MTKKIAIIEDSHDDYHALIGLLQAYDVEYFPVEDDFDGFSDMLNDYAQLREEDLCREIVAMVVAQQPDFILLDIGLNFNDEFDQSGKELEKKLIAAGISQQSIYYLTNKRPEKRSGYRSNR